MKNKPGAAETTKQVFRTALRRQGYSEKAIGEIWKWYNFSERKGVATSK